MIGWKRIVVTVGEKIGKSHLTYLQGASAEVVAACTIGLADLGGMPVSTTHVLSSGVAGTMWAARSWSAISDPAQDCRRVGADHARGHVLVGIVFRGLQPVDGLMDSARGAVRVGLESTPYAFIQSDDDCQAGYRVHGLADCKVTRKGREGRASREFERKPGNAINRESGVSGASFNLTQLFPRDPPGPRAQRQQATGGSRWPTEDGDIGRRGSGPERRHRERRPSRDEPTASPGQIPAPRR